MAIPSIYINLEDDVPKIVTRLKRNRAGEVILVCPKRCALFSDPENLKQLKLQTDALGQEVFILTMDEKGQQYAQAAGFKLKFLPKAGSGRPISDIAPKQQPIQQAKPTGPDGNPATRLASAVNEIRQMAKKLVPAGEEEKAEAVIVSPKLQSESIEKVEKQDAIFPAEVVEEVRHEPVKKPWTKIITGVVALSLVVILLLVFVILPKATVIVYARTEPVTRDMDVSLSTAAQNIDIDKLIIPATKIDEAATVTDTFQSQGKQQVGNKSVGTVVIYNFTKLPLNLKANTTTLNVGGKTYVLVNDVVGLKPTTYKNAKTKEVDPSSLAEPYQIMATQGGDDYNLPAGTRIEITNQVLGSKPQLVYAVSDSEITGGTTRYLSLITQDDANAAQAQLQNEALDQVRSKISSGGLVLPDKAFNAQVVQFTTDNPVGAQTPTFHATTQVKVSGLAYKQSDLENLIEQRIIQTLSANKTLKSTQSGSPDVTVKSLDLENQVAAISVHYEGQAVYDIDLPDISTLLVGKSQGQANELLRSKAEIDRVDITLAPVWQKTLPWFASKIDVSVAK